MKIPWPKEYRLLDKVLATFALVVITFACVAGFVFGLYVYIIGG